MAISRQRTLLALDEYAEIMEIPGWLFNQQYHPARPQRGGEMFWRQSGYYSDPNRIAGRDSIARAIATAERKIADHLGFWPAPTWICQEPHRWPLPARGTQTQVPEMKTRWGYLVSGGVEAWDPLGSAPIKYSDTDGDLVLDTATVVFDTYLTVTDICEVEVVPPGRDPTTREWRIRPLTGTLAAGVLTLTGPRWLFVDPDVWLTIDAVQLDDDTKYLETVDLYKHFNNSTVEYAEYKWLGGAQPCATALTPCSETCQTACATVTDDRNGIFYAVPATYSSGAWRAAAWALASAPAQVVLSYYAGYDDHSCWGCDNMGIALKEAIARLANVYLPENPCGRGLTRERWESDRQAMDMTTFDVALAQSAFGTTARGAVFARSVAATLEPLGKGGM